MTIITYSVNSTNVWKNNVNADLTTTLADKEIVFYSSKTSSSLLDYSTSGHVIFEGLTSLPYLTNSKKAINSVHALISALPLKKGGKNNQKLVKIINPNANGPEIILGTKTVPFNNFLITISSVNATPWMIKKHVTSPLGFSLPML